MSFSSRKPTHSCCNSVWRSRRERGLRRRRREVDPSPSTGNPLLCSRTEGCYWFTANEEDGLYSYGDSRHGDCDPPNLLCSRSFNVGDTRQTTGDEDKVLEWEVVSTTETVTVPADTFADCI
jgi:hypothetical protein